MRIISILLYLLVVPALAQSSDLGAGQCPQKNDYKAVDFQNEFGPQRLQGAVSWCFAYAGADLLTHYLYQQGEISGFSEAEIPSATAMALMSVVENDFEHVEGAVGVMRIRYDYKMELKDLESEKKKVIDYLKFLKKLRTNAWGEKLARILDEIRINEIAFAKIRQKIAFTKSEVDRLKFSFPTQYSSALERGGYAARAAVSMAKNGICSESKVQSSFMDTWELLPLDLVDNRGRADKLKILSRLVQYSEPGDIGAIKVIFPSASQELVSEVEENVSTEKLPFEIMNKVCEARPVKVLPMVSGFDIKDEKKPKAEEIENMFLSIDKQLDQRNAVVFSTDGDIFDYAGKPFAFEVGHAILIVGKRFNCEFNEPEYIIRNSWGPSYCEKSLSYFRRHNPYAINMTAAIEKRMMKCQTACRMGDQDEVDILRNCLDSCSERENANLIKVNRPPYTCENGNYVVRKSHLQKGSNSIRFLVPAN